VWLGHHIDTKNVLTDVKLLTGITPAITNDGNCFRVIYPINLSLAVRATGIISGRRVNQSTKLPNYIRDDSCPLVVKAMYLSGLFSGDGITVCLAKNTKLRNAVKGRS